MDSVINLVQEKLINKNDFPSFSSGDTISVFYEIREGEKIITELILNEECYSKEKVSKMLLRVNLKGITKSFLNPYVMRGGYGIF